MIGDDLWKVVDTLAYHYRTDTEITLPEDWEYRHYFNVPEEFFTADGKWIDDPITDREFWELAPSFKLIFQPDRMAFAMLVSSGIWVIEPPVCAMNLSRDLPVSYYHTAQSLISYQSLLIFTDERDLAEQQFNWAYIYPQSGDWFDLQLASFCDSHIISHSATSWWSAFLSDSEDIVAPAVNDHRIIPPGWKRT